MPPSKLQAILTQTDRLMIEERGLAARSLNTRASFRVGPPFQGFAVDLPASLRPPNAAVAIRGLVSRPDTQGSGEVLINDAGWAAIDEDRLGSNLPSLDANSSLDVVLIENFPLVDDSTRLASGNEAPQGIMLIAGDASNAGSFQMYRFSPSTSQWENIPWSGAGYGSASEPLADIQGDTASIESMPDATVFHAGAPNRSDGSGAIDQPVFIWTNNRDPVQVYPRTSGTLEYEPLTGQFDGTRTDAGFQAVSVETFSDRVYFLNTVETPGGTASSVRRRNRLRRTARGTADPNPGTLGAGFIDLDRFTGHGVACRTLGNVLACYFQDGVAFVRDTGDSAAPNAVQYLDTERGLLSTHAVVSISNNEHFGIFDDGWWRLDSSGRWREVGVLRTQTGARLSKWKRTFYDLLDGDRLYRLRCFYDKRRQWVRIILPTTAGSEEVWNYDVVSDRVWPDVYDRGITVWGEIAIPVETAVTWGTVSGSWDTISDSWLSLEVAESVQRVIHGDRTGFAYLHDDAITTRFGQEPTWSYEGDLSATQELPLQLRTLDRITTEYVNILNTGTVSVDALDNSANTSSTHMTTFSQGASSGTPETRRSTFRVTSTHLGWRVQGSGSVRIRGWQIDLLDTGVVPVESSA